LKNEIQKKLFSFINMNKWIWIAILLIIIVVGLYYYSYSGKNALTALEASPLLCENNNNAQGCIDTIIDVRTTAEWNNGHYPTAYHVPIQSIQPQNNILLNILNQASNILTYCNTGQRARYAAEQIRQIGFQGNVYYLIDSYKNL